jgi:hypothetical protein
MRLKPKRLCIVRSRKAKHKGCIFLKYVGTWDKFFGKLYPTNGGPEVTTELANRIIELVANFEGRELDPSFQDYQI